MKTVKKTVIAAIILLALLTGCNSVDAQYIQDITYRAMLQSWVASLEGYSCPIAFYGDSRVAGAAFNAEFSDLDPVGNKLTNLGVGGDRIKQTLLRLPLIEELEIEYCFLAIGGNDCLAGTYTEAGFRDQYDELLTKLEDLGVKVYAHTIVGITTANSSYKAKDVNRVNRWIAEANAIIKELAAEHPNTELIDLAEIMNETDGSMKAQYSADGVHFNTTGNQVWYDTLRPYLDELIRHE